ncbi:hypothetical protein DPMN_007231 [Dreissena polymorpha]|uniref:Uncharacterized protein n=1 Tax=Dreissena polymorpha TaxID=45954 RepID=A0A9D4RVU2_DREPO|nr:hypothetical protein DPMN_007231 [Dreissena polymorpha]
MYSVQVSIKCLVLVITHFTEEEKELIIDFLLQNQIIYSKRLTGYKDAATKDRLRVEQATKIKRRPSELKMCYESMRTKLGKHLLMQGEGYS